MRRIAGDEDTAVQVMLRQQQPLHPFGAMQHLVFDRRADDRLEQLRHVLVFLDDGMKREMLAQVLDDHQRPMIVDAVIVTGARRTHLS